MFFPLYVYDPRGRAIFDPRGMVGRIYKEDHHTLQNMILTPGAWLAGFIKRTTTHCDIQNMKALGLVVSEKKIFLYFSHDASGAGPVWTPGALLTGFIKKTIIHCYTQTIKAVGLVVSEKKIFFLCFSHCKSMEAICCHGNHSSDPT